MKLFSKILTKKSDATPPATHRQSRQQREEDAFMQEHGSPGNRAIYQLVEAVARCGKLPSVLFELTIFRNQTPDQNPPPKTSVLTQEKANWHRSHE